MKTPIVLAAGCWLAMAQAAGPAPVEPHHHLRIADRAHAQDVALTLDACGGAFDAKLIDLLVAQQVPATVFVTKRWLDRHSMAVRELLAQPELFELENHGTAHVPAIVGAHSRLYGMAGQPDVDHLRAEVLGAADRIRAVSGRAPRYFRGAGAAYDDTGRQTIEALGFRIAGFSVDADGGATLSAQAVAARLRVVKPGDVVIAHVNRPAGGTAEGFAAALPELRQRGLRFVKLSEAELVRVP
jgi:peptidoglycan/xylan/chitin deacetylase (PgdA/CDA1 family)